MKQNLETSPLCPYIYQESYDQSIWFNASIKPVGLAQVGHGPEYNLIRLNYSL